MEQGRIIFEGLMASYPKRLDLWNVYVDKEIKGGDVRAARNLLERLVSNCSVERYSSCTLVLVVQTHHLSFRHQVEVE